METTSDATLDNGVTAALATKKMEENGSHLQLTQTSDCQVAATTEPVSLESDTTMEMNDQPMVDLFSDAKPAQTNGSTGTIIHHDTVVIENEPNTNESTGELPVHDIIISQGQEDDILALNGLSSNKIVDQITPLESEQLEPLTNAEMTATVNNISQQNDIPFTDDTNSDIMTALQENLQNQMSAKAEAEDKVRKMELKVQLLEDQLQKQANEVLKLDTIQENLHLQMNAKAEAEHKARSAYDRVQQLETEKETNAVDLKQVQQQLYESREVVVDKDRELDRVRNERDELERKVTALTTRLNAAKKEEAVKVNHADEIEDDLKATTEELEHVKNELGKTKSAKLKLEQQLYFVEKVSKEHIEGLEGSLAEEKRLNEERKTKMKEYVDKKTEELRQVKEENDSLQLELTQTNRSFVELNTRWKQIHTQWVQAQTRNRELQRDLQRTKKDSEHLHKQGDTLEMKLSRSANETEEHKNKRLAAKQELMSVLRALELERDVTSKLRDQIKFTFVPKMLNQQQTLNEVAQEFTTALEKLSIRLGKALLPLPEESERDDAINTTNSNGSHNDNSSSQSDINPLVEKLDHEGQRISNAITAVSNNVERLRALVQASGDRTCFTVISELVSTGGMESSPAVQADRARNQLQANIGRSHRYGQIPGTLD